MRGFNAFEGFASAGAHFVSDMQVGPKCGCGEEPGDDGVEAGSDGGALAGEISTHRAGADSAEVTAEFGQVPAFAAKDAHAHAGLNDGIDLAGDGEDERGFAAAVRTEDGDVFTAADGEVDVVEDDAVAARDVDVAEVEEVGRIALVVIHV